MCLHARHTQINGQKKQSVHYQPLLTKIPSIFSREKTTNQRTEQRHVRDISDSFLVRRCDLRAYLFLVLSATIDLPHLKGPRGLITDEPLAYYGHGIQY